MRNIRVIPEVKLIMNALKLVALVRLLMVIAILSLSYCSLSRADDGFSSERKLMDSLDVSSRPMQICEFFTYE